MSDGQLGRDITTFGLEFNKHGGKEVDREYVDNGADISYEGSYNLVRTEWVERSGSYAPLAQQLPIKKVLLVRCCASTRLWLPPLAACSMKKAVRKV